MGKTEKIKEKKQKGGMDVTFLIIVLTLLAFGLIMMFSASYAYAYYRFGDSFNFIKKQALFAVAGVFLMIVISHIDYHKLKKLAYPLYIFTLILLVVVLFMPPLNGARRWIQIGEVLSIQPSEIMKFAIIILFALIISKNYKKMGTFVYGVVPFMIFFGIVAVLMMLEPHISGTLLIAVIALSLMFVGGTKYRYFFVLAGLIVLGVAAIVMIKGVDYAMVRINGWLDPFHDTQDETYQTVQSLIAIGSGGFMGLGLGQSRQKYLFLPEPQNDFIFAIVCEELGFIGAAIIILLFLLFVYRGFSIAAKAPDKFGMLVAVGLTVQIGIQAMLNIAVVSNTIPNTGISLPFFSYGGSALFMQLCEMGVLLNISRHGNLIKS